MQDKCHAKYTGKVRDIYDYGSELEIIATDRLSAFDRQIAQIPGKGEVLSQLSAWWFEQTRHIVPNHFLRISAPNAMRVKKCKVFPVEFVVRGYITGSTDTSLWRHYARGEREYCGNVFPDGLVKNQQLKTPVVTPTTKEADHDRPISPKEIIESGLMTEAQWCEVCDKVLALYQFGAKTAAAKGWILVDTKYELGVDGQGVITLVDEVHTPDSSRYWKLESYRQRLSQGLEPESFDKEFIRLWLKEQCDPYQDEMIPRVPEEMVLELSKRYRSILTALTGKDTVTR